MPEEAWGLGEGGTGLRSSRGRLGSSHRVVSRSPGGGVGNTVVRVRGVRVRWKYRGGVGGHMTVSPCLLEINESSKNAPFLATPAAPTAGRGVQLALRCEAWAEHPAGRPGAGGAAARPPRLTSSRELWPALGSASRQDFAWTSLSSVGSSHLWSALSPNEENEPRGTKGLFLLQGSEREIP